MDGVWYLTRNGTISNQEEEGSLEVALVTADEIEQNTALLNEASRLAQAQSEMVENMTKQVEHYHSLLSQAHDVVSLMLPTKEVMETLYQLLSGALYVSRVEGKEIETDPYTNAIAWLDRFKVPNEELVQ